MQIYRGKELARFKSRLDRVPDRDVIPVPEHFHDDRLDIRRDVEYALKDPATVGEVSRTTFWNEPIELSISPTETGAVPRTIHNGRPYTRTVDNTHTRMHNIQMGHVGILEHPSAAATVLGVQFDIKAETQKPSLGLHRAMQAVGLAKDVVSLPTYPDLNDPYLDAMEGNIMPVGDTNFITVNEPVVFAMDGSYILVEPDDSRLILDHQISYPNNPAIGTQRIVADMTPEFFAFIASARTPAFGVRSKLARLTGFMKSIPTLPYTALGMHNVVAVGKNGIVQPRDKFEASPGGPNLEVLCHELIDKAGWLEGLENTHGGRFAGRITTFRTNHTRDIQVAQAMHEQEMIVPVSSGSQQRRAA